MSRRFRVRQTRRQPTADLPALDADQLSQVVLTNSVVAFDGRAMVLRWMNPEVQNRYGTGVYVRCGAEGAARRAPR